MRTIVILTDATIMSSVVLLTTLNLASDLERSFEALISHIILILKASCRIVRLWTIIIFIVINEIFVVLLVIQFIGKIGMITRRRIFPVL